MMNVKTTMSCVVTMMLTTVAFGTPTSPLKYARGSSKGARFPECGAGESPAPQVLQRAATAPIAQADASPQDEPQVQILTPPPPEEPENASRALGTDPPRWAFDAVWYYVLVPRFANGSKDNDPPETRPFDEPWPDASNTNRAPQAKAELNERRFGGDLQGLSAKLPYLKELGCNALCLTPVFAATSDDGYAVTDYRHISDALAFKGSAEKLSDERPDSDTWQWTGSDRMFLDFVKKAHEMGFHVIVDAVFSFAGTDFWIFEDVKQFGSGSTYKGWFDITGFDPLQWNGPLGPNGPLVNFRQARTGLDPTLENHLFAVTRRWMDPNGDGKPEDGIDGWRLDNVDAIDHGFWERWCAQVRRINPDVLIVGELWRDANDWLEGDELDCVLNYKAAGMIRRYFARDSGDYPTSLFMKGLDDARAPFSLATNLAALNLLDSPDTDRILTRLSRPQVKHVPGVEPGGAPDGAPPEGAASDGSKDKPAAPGSAAGQGDTSSSSTPVEKPEASMVPSGGPRAQENPQTEKPAEPKPSSTPQDAGASAKPDADPPKKRGDGDLDLDLDRWRLATAFKAFYIGAPVTYYGDEVGMTGDGVPFNRAPMWWADSQDAAKVPKGFQPTFLELTRLLNTLRRAHEPLRLGACRTVLADDARRVLAFARFMPQQPDDEVIVLMNASDEKQTVQLKVGRPGGIVGVLAPQLRPQRATGPKLNVNGSRAMVSDQGDIELTLEPMSVRLILAKE